MAIAGPCRRLLVVLLAALVLDPGPALAQAANAPPVTQSDNALVLDTMGHTISMPLPDWLDASQRGAGPVWPQVESRFAAGAGQAVLEIYPKGQTQALWTTLYGARVSLEPGRSLGDYRRSVMVGYGRTCKPELTGFFQFGTDTAETLAPMGFVCGGYLDRLGAFAGLGEVMVMSFRKSDMGIAVVYQEWRGNAFDPAQPDTWPVATATVEARAAELQDEVSLTLTP